MSTKQSQQATLKKLMKIIYDKEKQIDKYRKQLRQKQRSKPNVVQASQLGLSCQQKDFITKQIIENKRFLQIATAKLYDMEGKITELQADLDEEQNRNQILQDQIFLVKAECQDKQKQIVELHTIKQLLENTKIYKNGEISEKEIKIQSLLLENKKVKIISEQVHTENIKLKERIHNMEMQINKSLKFLHKNLRCIKKQNKSQVDLNFNFSRVIKRSQKQIKTHTFIHEKLQQTIQQKIHETVQMMKKWEQNLNRRQDQLRKNFQKALSEHSFDGISNFVSQSILIKNSDTDENKLKGGQESNFYQTSVYKRNEEQLLNQLERQCKKQDERDVQQEKQKLVELSEIKQSLKMTKQVNQQLFEQLNRQQNMIKIFKQTFKNLQKKKLINNEDNEQVRKLRSILGSRN